MASPDDRPSSSPARVPLFAGLAAAALEGLEPFTFERTFKPGDFIVEEGRTGGIIVSERRRERWRA